MALNSNVLASFSVAAAVAGGTSATVSIAQCILYIWTKQIEKERQQQKQ